jgi:hypothetical protein
MALSTIVHWRQQRGGQWLVACSSLPHAKVSRYRGSSWVDLAIHRAKAERAGETDHQ